MVSDNTKSNNLNNYRVTTEEFLEECTKNVQNFLECTKMYIHQNVPKDVHKF